MPFTGAPHGVPCRVMLGLKLTTEDTKSGQKASHTFGQFPVRIGRSPLNDLPLGEAFVSQFHAVVEVDGDRVLLRDLGSSNGTSLGEGKAPPHELIDLATTQGAFAIKSLGFRAELVEVSGEEVAAHRRQKPLLDPSAVRAAQGMVATVIVGDDDAAAVAGGERGSSGTLSEPPPASDLDERVRAVAAANNAFREGWPQVRAALARGAEGLSPADKARFFEGLRGAIPGLVREPDFQQLATGKKPGENDAELADVAYRAVLELARGYFPVRPLKTKEDVVRFLTNVRDVLDVFFRGFIPLRDGHRQFETELDIRRDPKNSQHDDPVAAAVGKANTAPSLGARLLGWETDTTSGLRALEGTFADVMIHQLALMNGVMRGVKSLLRELSPETVDQNLEELAKKGEGGFRLGPYRFKRLWDVYAARHADVDDGEKRTFQLLFGAQFAQSYAQYSALGRERAAEQREGGPG